MLDVYSEPYYKLYEDSKKVDKRLENFALITCYDSELQSYTQKEVRLENASLIGLLESKTSDMVSVVLYSRGIGLIDDIEVYGEPENIGRTIYFGTMMTVAEYNGDNLGSLSLPLDQQICILDCGQVLTEVEPGSDTSLNVLTEYKRITGHKSRLLI